MSTPTPDEDTRALGLAVAALASSLARVTRRVGEQGNELRTLAQGVAQLTKEAAGQPLTPTLDGAPEAAVVDLLDWIADVYLAYDGAVLAPCWAYHPGIVEELTWLRGVHQLVYQSADLLRIGDWHDRYRPGVVRRVLTATTTCDITKHLAGDRPVVPLAATLGPIAAARAARTAIPAPTAEQIEQARRLTTRTGGRA